MSANVETMFYTRVAPWHGLGTRVEEAPDSREALILAGLDWQVIQKPIMTGDGQPIDGFKANIRDRDGQVLETVCRSREELSTVLAQRFGISVDPADLRWEG